MRTLNVNDTRPVGAAVRSLIAQYPVVITYEDAQYVYSGDLQDLTAQVRKEHLNARNIVVPRRGVLQAKYKASQHKGDGANVAAALDSVVQANNRNPAATARFTVRQIGNAFHVLPSEVRDSTGAWINQTSILDTRITLSSGEESGYALIESVLKAVKEASGADILGLSADGFVNTLTHYNGNIEAKDEPASDV